MSTIKINELATSNIALTDFFAKADATGVASKNTIQELSNLLKTVDDTAFKGSIAIADVPYENGWYFASESGTYTNCGGLIIDTTDNIAIIIVSGTFDTFNKIDIPVNITIDANPTDGSNNAVSSNGVFDALALKLNGQEFLYADYVTSGSTSSLTEVTLNANGHYFEATIVANNVSGQGGYNIARKPNASDQIGVWTNGFLYVADNNGFISTNAFNDAIVNGEKFKLKVSYEDGNVVTYKNDVLQKTIATGLQENLRISRIGDGVFSSLLKDVTIVHSTGTLSIPLPSTSSDLTNTNVTTTQFGFELSETLALNNFGLVTSDLAKKGLDLKIDANFDAKPLEGSTKQVDSGNQFTYLKDNFTKRTFFIDGLEQVLGTIDLERGSFIYSQKGLGIKTLTSPASGTYSFNSLDLYLGTLRAKSDLIVRVYSGNFSGSNTKIPSNFNLLAEKEVKNIPVNDTELFTVVFDNLIDFTSAGSIDFITVFISAKELDVSVLVPYSNVQNGTSTRSGIYYTLAASNSDIWNETFNYAGQFLTNTLNFKIVQEKQQIQNYKPFIRISKKVYAVVGKQLNLYYDSLINGIDGGKEGLKNYTITIKNNSSSSTNGSSLQRMWQYTPVVGDIGTDKMIIEIVKDGVIVNTKYFELITIASTAPSTQKTFLDLGDSNTDFSQVDADKTQTLFEDFTALTSNIPTFQGGRNNGAGLKNEGNGGFSFESYATNTGSNPLWNLGAIDISNYRSVLGMGVTKFDLVSICLLTNDANSFTGSGFAIYNEDKANEILQYAKNVVDAFLADNASTKIVINLPPLIANTKNVGGKNYELLKYNLFKLSELFLANFDDGIYNTNVTMGIAGLSIDRYYGYAKTSTQIADRIIISEDWHNNSFHPNNDGYEQMADGMFPQLLNLLG